MAIDDLIARPPAFDFNQLPNPLEGYVQGRAVGRQRGLEDAFANGLPRGPDGQIDFPQMLNTLARYSSGQDQLLNIGKAAMEEKAAADFARMFGGAGGAAQQPSIPSMAGGTSGTMPTAPAPRAPSQQQSSASPPPMVSAPVAPDDPTMTVSPRQVALANGVQPPAATPPAAITPPTRQVPPTQQTSEVAPPVGQAPGQRVPVNSTVAPTQTQNPVAGNITALIAAASNPRLPGPQREAAKLMLQRALDDSKLTDEQKEYILYQAQERAAGRTPRSFFDFKIELRRAGAPPPAESEYDKQMAQVFTEYNKTSIKSANDSRNQIAALTRLGQLLSLPSVYQGTGGEFVTSLKRMATSLGVTTGDIPDGAAAGDAIRSIANQMALQLRNPSGGAGMPGAMSDSDREFLRSMAPGLTGTPDGNKLIIDYMRRVAQRNIDVERQRQQYVQQNGRLDERFFNQLAEWSNRNPLFSAQDQQALQAAGNTATAVPSTGANVVPSEVRSLPANEQLQRAPIGSVATINGVRSFKDQDGNWKPLNAR